MSHVQGHRRVCGLSVQDTVEVLLKGMFLFSLLFEVFFLQMACKNT